MPSIPGATALTQLLVVSDVAASKTFYVDVLGAELYREYGGTSVVLQLMGNWLLLVTRGGPTPDKPDVDFVVPDATRATAQMIFRVDDCKVAYDELVRRGATFLTPPYERSGETRCFFRDPDGHLFEISALT